MTNKLAYVLLPSFLIACSDDESLKLAQLRADQASEDAAQHESVLKVEQDKLTKANAEIAKLKEEEKKHDALMAKNRKRFEGMNSEERKRAHCVDFLADLKN